MPGLSFGGQEAETAVPARASGRRMGASLCRGPLCKELIAESIDIDRVLSRELGHGIPDEQQGARDTVKCRYCPVPICT